MALTREEKETIVLFNEAEDTMEVFTHNKALIRKLQKYAETSKEVKLKKVNEEEGYTFILPKNWFNIRQPKQLSEETKQKLRDRIKNQF